MTIRDPLIRRLADGRVHSGSALAAELGVSRSAIWKQLHGLSGLGLRVRSKGRRGYCLDEAIELLDRERIFDRLDHRARASCELLEIVSITRSTNAMLAAATIPAAGMWRGAFAEYQTAGRGRRGRRWLSPFGSGLCFSVSWCFATAPRDLPALSLAAGIAVGRALAASGASGIALKWPNDVVVHGQKLAGILVDVDGDSRGPLRAIIGVGLNITVPPGLAADIALEGALAPAGLDSCTPPGSLSRNDLAARLLSALVGVLHGFARDGFEPLADEWRRQDFLWGRTVTVRQGDTESSGIARGIAADGALLVEGPAGIAAVFNGDVSLRAAA